MTTHGCPDCRCATGPAVELYPSKIVFAPILTTGAAPQPQFITVTYPTTATVTATFPPLPKVGK